MKKLSVFMAALAAVTMAVNSGYADMSVYAKTDKSVTEAAEKTAALKGETEVKTNFKIAKAMLVSDDRVYYMGNNKGRNVTIFSTDYEGNIKNSLEIKSDLKDENGAFSAYGDTMKQVGDYFYYFYKSTPYIELDLPENGEWVAADPTVFTSYYYTPQSFKCLKLDKELNIIDEYELKDYAKSEQFIDINSTQICYLTSSNKIYLANCDGSEKKLMYKVGDDESGIQRIDSIAMNDDYIAFAAAKSSGTAKKYYNSRGGYTYAAEPDKKYCGIIDLKTGEVKIKEKNGAAFPTADKNGITWENNSSESPWKDKSAGAVYTYDGENFKSVTAKTAYESFINSIDNDGRIVTYNSQTYTLRVYQNGKCIKEIDTKSDNMTGNVSFTANNGVAAITYTDTKSGTACKVKLTAY